MLNIETPETTRVRSDLFTRLTLQLQRPSGQRLSSVDGELDGRCFRLHAGPVVLPEAETARERVGVAAEPAVWRQLREPGGVASTENDVVGLERGCELRDRF